MRQESDGTKKWYEIERLRFCIDHKLYKQGSIKIIVREIIEDHKDRDKIEMFETVGE